MNKKVIVLGMGGTIAGRSSQAGDNVGYKAGEVGVADLLAAVPGISVISGAFQVEAEQVAQIDSKDIEDAHWLALAKRVDHYLSQADIAAIVVTHGTDTLEETAFFLSRVLSQAQLAIKPVVLACAMRPASSLHPDGPQNLLDAMAVAVHPGACGVLAVCAGAIHGAKHIQKMHPYQLAAFDSGDAGPLGYVEEGRVRLVQAWPVPVISGSGGWAWTPERLPPLPWPRVEIVVSHASSTGALVDAICLDSQAELPLRGIVVAGTGNGTIHRDLEAALLRARNMGVRVVRSTRCAYGSVVQSDVSPVGAVEATSLSAVKARVQLVLDLIQQPEQPT